MDVAKARVSKISRGRLVPHVLCDSGAALGYKM
jgi:hypothetical protein